MAAECKLAEAKKQYDMMLEGKQLELSKHLKELSQRNDQVLIFCWWVLAFLHCRIITI